MTWPAGSLRPIVDYGDWPRYVGTERQVPPYYPTAALPNATTNVIGHIAQVNRTFGYYEGNYAVANDQGVAFGESSCSAKTFAKSVAAGGPSLLSMYELSRLAAERAATARDAVQLMGDLAVEHGFYADASTDTGGESILVTDGDEGYIFHILAESEEKGGAIWCAARVPADEVAVVANSFAIGFVDPAGGGGGGGGGDFLYSANMHEVARQRGWWDGKGRLHFARTFSAGEYASKYYSGRRMWGFWNVTAPSLRVPAEYDSYLEAVGTTYPVSAKPDAPLTQQDVLRKIYRNYYKGSKYDLSAGPAAGPFGTPMRSKPGPGAEAVAGTCGTGADGDAPCNRWERPIASFRTTMIYLTQVTPSSFSSAAAAGGGGGEPGGGGGGGGGARGGGSRHYDGALPVTWFVPGAALGGVFVPVPVAAAAVPEPLGTCSNTVMDRSTAYWAYREVTQFAYPRWSLVEPAIVALGAELEEKGAALVDSLRRRGGLSRKDNDARHVAALAENRRRLAAHVADVVGSWQDLYSRLFIQYSDGWNYGPTGAGGQLEASRVGYPTWWLKEVGYADGPPSCKSACP